MFRTIRENLKPQKGFTLVELMVVIAIIGILAAIAVPKFSSAADSAAKAKIQADLRTLDSASMIYYAQNNSYPTGTTALTTLETAKLISTGLIPPAKYKTYAPAAYAVDANGRWSTTINNITIYAASPDTDWGTIQ